MKIKTRITAVLAALFATAACAQEFWLTNSATGERSGPFQFREGAQLVLSNQTFVIQKVLTEEQKVIEKMKAIVIPEIEFRQADVHDVIAFLTQATREIEEPSKADKAFGLSAICITDPKPMSVSTTGDPFAEAPVTNALPTITLNARFISLYDAVDMVSELAGLSWKVQGKVILFQKQEVQPATAPYSEPAARSHQR